METSEPDLSSLGLNGYESSVYVALLGRSGLTSSEAANRARIPRQRIYDILQSLESKGLCTARDTSPKTFYPVDPGIALPVLSQLRAGELERERRAIAESASLLAATLGPLFLAGLGQNDPLQYVEILADPIRIATRATALAGAAKIHVNSLIKRPLILSSEQNREYLHAPLERGIRYRALYEHAAREDAELSEWMADLSAKGQEVRLAESLPVKMQAFDDEIALLSMQDPVGGPPSFTALAIRHRGTVALLNLAFERLWEQGEPYP